MGCCGNRENGFPSFELLIANIIKQQRLQSIFLSDIPTRYYENLKPLNLTNFSAYMKTLFTPLLYTEEKEKTKEDLLTEYFLSFYNEKIKNNQNVLLSLFAYCTSFLPFQKGSDQENTIFNFLQKEKLNTVQGFNDFLDIYLKFNLLTMTEMVYEFCSKNIGSKVFDIKIDSDFMKEFAEVKNMVYNKETVEKYIKGRKEKSNRLKEFTLKTIMITNNSLVLFKIEKLRKDFLESFYLS